MTLILAPLHRAGWNPLVGTPKTRVFSDVKAGQGPGYHWDGWTDATQRVFYYTGEGQEGDQRFTHGNLALRDAATNGKSIHLFMAAGTAPGSTAIQHRYEGEFVLDPEHGWRREDGPDQGFELRSAIVFRLLRAEEHAAPASAGDASPAEAETPSKETTVEVVDAEGHHVDEFVVPGTKAGMAYRRERAVEQQLTDELARQGVEAARLKITVRGQSKPLWTDTWDKDHRKLYEAKGTVARAKVREAIGQLLDYRRHITPPPETCTVLLPMDPGEDLTELIHGCGFDLVYLEGSKKLVRKVTS
ncbi:MAG: hypothetical protein DI613_14145 [Kocuria rhizophila]|nr:MAG: hypothetical protein DI613_14145 [Kocuria rhizophila]